MNGFVKTVFTVIYGVVLAGVLYILLFGTSAFNGTELFTMQIKGTWKGALWYMAEALETPISRYYYDYTFIPNIHNNDYVDEALGGRPSWKYYHNGKLYLTETDLSKDPFYNKEDTYRFDGVSSGISTFSTGWN